ncbi:hypothetical protein ACFLZX_06020 [Nanoarchaeota archaeon]
MSVFYSDNVGDFITTYAVATTNNEVENFAAFFPLTGFSGEGSNFCIIVGDQYFDVTRSKEAFIVVESTGCEPLKDLVIKFPSKTALVSQNEDVGCQQIFTRDKFSFEKSLFWDNGFNCNSEFRKSYCQGINICGPIAAQHKLVTCCLTNIDTVTKETPKDIEKIETPPPEKSDDIVGQATGSLDNNIFIAIYAIGGLFLIVAGVLVIIAKKRKTQIRNKLILKVSLWARKSKSIGFSEEKIISELNDKKIPKAVINRAISIAFGKR